MEKTVRIANVNINNAELGNIDRYNQLASNLKLHEIEIVALQEVIDLEGLKEILKPIGFDYFEFTRIDGKGGNGVAAKFPIKNDFHVEFKNNRDSIIAQFELNNKHFYVCSSHLAWGGENEVTRLRQAAEIDTIAASILFEDTNKQIPSIFILAGDLNSDEDSRTSRFLHGLDLDLDHKSTYWTDAWEVCGTEENRWTSDQGKSTVGRITASQFNITRFEQLPARRIDYLLTRGWVYGKSGCAISFNRFGQPIEGETTDMSDHFGIYADIVL